MEVACRNPQQIADDDMCEAHSMCVEALNMLVPRAGLLYTGARRKKIDDFKQMLERMIESGKTYRGYTTATYAAYHAIHH